MANRHMQRFFQLPLADHAAPSGAGIDHGSIATARSRTPRWVKYQAIQAFISGTKRNGSRKTGFMIIGKPNNIGSLMLNSEGSRPIFPTLFSCRERLRIAINTSGSVEPMPPISR